MEITWNHTAERQGLDLILLSSSAVKHCFEGSTSFRICFVLLPACASLRALRCAFRVIQPYSFPAMQTVGPQVSHLSILLGPAKGRKEKSHNVTVEHGPHQTSRLRPMAANRSPRSLHSDVPRWAGWKQPSLGGRPSLLGWIAIRLEVITLHQKQRLVPQKWRHPK